MGTAIEQHRAWQHGSTERPSSIDVRTPNEEDLGRLKLLIRAEADQPGLCHGDLEDTNLKSRNELQHEDKDNELQHEDKVGQVW